MSDRILPAGVASAEKCAFCNKVSALVMAGAVALAVFWVKVKR